MDIWRHDLLSSLHALRRSPGFTLVTVVSAALGIGMATLAFGVAYALLWIPLPFPQPDRLAAVSMERSTEELAVPSRVSAPEFFDLGAQSRSFAAQTAYRERSLTVIANGRPEQVPAAEVSADFFRVLGVMPQLGRTLRPDDDRLPAPPVAVLGDRLWRRRFGGDPGVVGRTILVDETAVTVIGVMPPGFRFPRNQELWVPLAGRLEASPPRAIRNLRMAVRLRPGVSLADAQREVRAIGDRFAARYPESTAGWSGYVRPLRANSLNPETRLALRYLGGASAFIFLIACANLTHLLLVRMTARRQELAVRAAFGAGPGRLARQIFTESALLAGAGGVLGTAFSALLVARVGELEVHTGYASWVRFALGLPALLFALAATAAFALLLGLPAAWREARRKDLSPVLKETADAGGSRRLQRLRAALLVSEIAASVVLLAGASLTVRSLLALRSEPGGVRPSHLVTLWTRFPSTRYEDGTARARAVRGLLARLRAIPGVQEAAAAEDIPHTFSAGEGLVSPLRQGGPPGPALRIQLIAVSPGYFQTLGAPLRSGHDVTGGPETGEAVVNETLARSLWPDGPAAGQTVRLGHGGSEETFRVGGVVADIRHRLLSARAGPTLYIPLAAGDQNEIGFLLRTRLSLQRLLPAAEQQIHRVDPWLPVFGAATLDEIRSGILVLDRQRSQTALLCAVVALVLALLGVYAVLSFTIGQQLRGIGVRLALGATRWQVMRQIVGRGLALTLVGLALGLAGALLLGRLLAPFLYQVSPADPVSFAAISILVFDAAFIACYLPARRVLGIYPVAVLREE
jgi:predicted permease